MSINQPNKGNIVMRFQWNLCFCGDFMIFVWKGYIGYCTRIILKHYEGTLWLEALCSKNNAPRNVIPLINLMQLFMLHRMVPSIWLNANAWRVILMAKSKIML
jgi:hypothetical protein